MWLKALRDEEQIKCHVALTPTWNEIAWFADYVLPMGHAGERHDLMSQETHAGQWIAFRQPVRRVAMEKLGKPVKYTWEANPGEVWEENELWMELSVRMDPDGSLGVRQWFESPYRPGEPITQDEYYRWIFEQQRARSARGRGAEGLTPLAYMRKYGSFEVKRDKVYFPYEQRGCGRRSDGNGGRAGASACRRARLRGGGGRPGARSASTPPAASWSSSAHAAPMGLAGTRLHDPLAAQEPCASRQHRPLPRGRCCCCPTSACRR
jgi:anaerobic selenocysteine-containing dehydrogenase